MKNGVSQEILHSVKDIPCQISAGKYTIKLAETAEEIQKTQELRARIFFKHLSQKEQDTAESRDFFAHHLIVVFHDKDENDEPLNRIVGTLRLINSDYLPATEQFYSQEYYEFDELLKTNKRSLELSRFCIEEKYRKGSILLLIWKSAMAYINHVKVDMMFGISSFSGQNPQDHADVLSLLHKQYLAPLSMMPKPLKEAHAISDMLIEDVATERKLPTLMRGYLKMGGKISDTFYVDPVFNTTFVFLYVEFKNYEDYVKEVGKA